MAALLSWASCEIRAGASGALSICSFNHAGSSAFLRIAEKVVDVLDARPGKNSLTADAAVFFQEIGQQLDFQIVPGREVGVPAFAGERMMPEAIPVKARHAQAGAGGDHGAIAFRILRALAAA